jgi:chromosome segregation ATPase
VWIAACLLLAGALGYLVPDQVRARHQYVQARAALGVARQRTRAATAQLDELRRDLSILESQLGSDFTALSQDSSQLLGAQTSLAAARAHVTQQAQLIGSLQTCLAGVEQALNELSIGKQSAAIAALNAVSTGCSAAEASSG